MTSQSTSTWHSTPATSERIVSAIGRIANVLRAGSWQFATAEGLNPTQVDILEILLSREEGVRLSWLAEQIGVTTASASDSVASLVTKNLVLKGRAADDGRAIALRLTREGKTLAKKIRESMDFAFSAVDAMPDVQRDALFASLLGLIGQLQMSERFPDIRTCVTCEHFAANKHKNKEAPHHCRLVDAPLPANMLRLDCAEHQAADTKITTQTWEKLKRV